MSLGMSQAGRRLGGGVTVAAVAALGAASPAFGETFFQWHWEPGVPGDYVYNGRGGEINSIDASFDPATNRLTWVANFGPPTGETGLQTNGFTLALNHGPDPIGTVGELAMLYFDATGGDPIISVYGYNATNLNESWRDGQPAPGVQPPDQIISSVNETSWVNDAFVVNEADGSRSMGFTIDATAINNHNPLYTSPLGSDVWSGISFSEMLGVWFHPYANLETSYEDGFLSEWSYIFQNRGWLDGTHFETVVIPLPPAVLLGAAGLAGVLLVRRRLK